MALILEILTLTVIAGGIAAAYDVARRWLSAKAGPSDLAALTARVDENERAFKAVLVDWRTRFNELDMKVDALPKHVDAKVAGTIAAVGALPSAPKQWR